MKQKLNLGTEYRIVTDGKRFRIQEKTAGSGWVEHEYKTILTRWFCERWLRFAKAKVFMLRDEETRRVQKLNTAWEVVG